MKESVPVNIFERLEREWRIIDPDRTPTTDKIEPAVLPLRRLRINRFDEIHRSPKD